MASNLESIKEELKKSNDSQATLLGILSAMSSDNSEQDEKEHQKRERKQFENVNKNLKKTKDGLKPKKPDESFLGILGDNLMITLGTSALGYIINNGEKINEFTESLGSFLNDGIEKVNEFSETWEKDGLGAALSDFVAPDGEMSNLMKSLLVMTGALGGLAGIGALDKLVDSIDKRKKANADRKAKLEAERKAKAEAKRAKAEARRAKAAQVETERFNRAARNNKVNASMGDIRSRTNGIPAAEKRDLANRGISVDKNGNLRNAAGTTDALGQNTGGRLISAEDGAKALNEVAEEAAKRSSREAAARVATAEAAEAAAKVALEEAAVAASKEKIVKNVASKIGGAAVSSIPILGDVIGLGFAAWSMYKGDFVTAGLEAVGVIPIVGIPADIASIPTGVYFEVYGEQYTGAPGQTEKMKFILEEFEKQLDESAKEADRKAFIRGDQKSLWQSEGMRAEDALMSQSITGFSEAQLYGMSPQGFSEAAQSRASIQKTNDARSLLDKINENISLSEEENDLYNELVAEGFMEVIAPSIGVTVMRNNNITASPGSSMTRIED